MTFREYLSDEYSAAWAAITTVICVVILGGSNVLLFAAAGGTKVNGVAPLSWQMLWAISGGLVVAVFLVAYLIVASALRSRPSAVPQDQQWKFTVGAAGACAALALLCCVLAMSVSWLAGTGRAVLWGPIVATSLGTVAVVSFGGYYLASRRARIAIAATWLLFFLSLLSFMLTLEVLVEAVDGDSPGITAANSAVSEMLTDFRGQVGLVFAFYFGTDAAINAFKILRMRDQPAADMHRADRDLATSVDDARG